jgi:hypothetical protein
VDRLRGALARSLSAAERALAAPAAIGAVLLLAIAVGAWLAWRAG